jgi:serine/threonine protein kinase
MSDHWRDLQEIFDEACPLGEPSRGAFLDRRCGCDAELRAEADRLLRSHEEERAANIEARTSVAPRRFGVWETIRLLGRGGMGEVWLARRVDGQHDQVAAVKVLSPYLAGPESLHRFKRERQLLARLEHPGIARLLDGGINQDGEPFLVMEYVEGIRLERYSDDHRLSIEARLRLFTKVCSAVVAAHQHFVVHRDLKPSNILVTADGEPKLLDFGIAKVVDVDAGLEQTATANLFLTPLYASPEILRGQPATVASDVYSLGVVLYELLSGHRPFDSARLSPAGLVEATTERDADRPSAAVSRGSASEIAARRGTTPERLKKALAGDVDCIVLKSLATKPSDRYGSAAQFAEDIDRYLEGQPVIAVERSRLYVARKFVRRHLLPVAAFALLVLSLVAGMTGTLWQAHVAQQERAAAEQRFSDARQMANYLLFDLYDAVGKNPGNLPVQADMARRSLQYLDRMAAIKSADPKLRMELGEGYLRLGVILHQGTGIHDSLGETTKAIEAYRKALALVEPLVRKNSGDVAARRTLASIEGQLGANLARTGQYDEAFRWLRTTAEELDRLAVANPSDVTDLLDAGSAWETYGTALSEKGGYINVNGDAASYPFRKSVEKLTAVLRIDAANPRALLLLAQTYFEAGKSETSAGPGKSIESFSLGMSFLALLPAERQTAEVRRLQALLLLRTGWSQGQLGKYDTSLRNMEEACRALDQLAAEDPGNFTAAFRRVDAYRSLGLVYGYAKNRNRSLADLRKATEILAPLASAEPTAIAYGIVLGELQGRVANLLAQSGRMAEARPFAEASVAYYTRVGDTPSATVPQLMEAVRSVGETEVKPLRDCPAALRFALRADALSKGKNPAVLGYLAQAYEMNGKYAEATDAAKRGLASIPTGDAPSKLRTWLQEEFTKNEAKALAKVVQH